MNISFESKVVLITGASKGIGLACARLFAQAGAHVVGISRSNENLIAARAELQADGLDMITYAVDLVDGAAAAQTVEAIEREVGPISVLVNSAGAAKRSSPEQLGEATFRLAMDAKFFTYMNVQDPVAKLMASRNRGSIVNIVGTGGKQPTPYHIAGGAANAALMLTTTGYARAYAAHGVRVNAINPGLTQTERVDEGITVQSVASGRSKDEVMAEQLAVIPMGRFGQPQEVANVAVFLASDLASYVSGAVIPMDGCAISAI